MNDNCQYLLILTCSCLTDSYLKLDKVSLAVVYNLDNKQITYNFYCLTELAQFHYQKIQT